MGTIVEHHPRLEARSQPDHQLQAWMDAGLDAMERIGKDMLRLDIAVPEDEAAEACRAEADRGARILVRSQHPSLMSVEVGVWARNDAAIELTCKVLRVTEVEPSHDDINDVLREMVNWVVGFAKGSLSERGTNLDTGLPQTISKQDMTQQYTGGIPLKVCTVVIDETPVWLFVRPAQED